MTDQVIAAKDAEIAQLRAEREEQKARYLRLMETFQAVEDEAHSLTADLATRTRERDEAREQVAAFGREVDPDYTPAQVAQLHADFAPVIAARAKRLQAVDDLAALRAALEPLVAQWRETARVHEYEQGTTGLWYSAIRACAHELEAALVVPSVSPASDMNQAAYDALGQIAEQLARAPGTLRAIDHLIAARTALRRAQQVTHAGEDASVPQQKEDDEDFSRTGDEGQRPVLPYRSHRQVMTR